jgi:general secretion pathway protein I
MKINSKSAFTLIEVVLAMSVMASGLFILTNSWSTTYARLKTTNVKVQLAALLERKIVEIEREYKNKSLETIPEEKEDNFGEELPEYSWKMTSQKLELPNLSTVLESQQDGAKVDLLSLMKIFTEHLSKSVKEVKVSVTYKGTATRNKKPLTVDVVFYMIDYDRPLPIPGGAG